MLKICRFGHWLIDLGSSLVAKNIGLVYGGGRLGLMGAVANSVIEGGGDIVGVVPEFFEGKQIKVLHSCSSEFDQ